jgi:hypothetical protein
LVWLIPGLLIVSLFFFKTRLKQLKRLGLVVGISGFVLMSLETLILLLFQTKIGHLYSFIGLIFALVLLGMAGGVWLGDKGKKPRTISTSLLAYWLVLALLFLAKTWFSFIWFWLLLSFLVGGVGGWVFGLTNSAWLKRNDDPSFIYSWDLFGSFAGAILTSVFLLPNLGLTGLLGFFALLTTIATLQG